MAANKVAVIKTSTCFRAFITVPCCVAVRACGANVEGVSASNTRQLPPPFDRPLCATKQPGPADFIASIERAIYNRPGPVLNSHLLSLEKEILRMASVNKARTHRRTISSHINTFAARGGILSLENHQRSSDALRLHINSG